MKKSHPLKTVRRGLAIIMFLLITLMFLDFTGTLHHYLHWLAHIQLLPAILALNVGIVVALLVLTLIFGRIYCSVICPLGILQDGIAHIHTAFHKNRYRYSNEKRILRYAVFVVFVACLLGGVGAVVSLLAPYSSFGRMATSLLQPVYIMCNNLLASIAEHYDSYAFYSREVWMRSVVTTGVAAATFIIIGVMAWIGGRTYCNTICPVGTLLSFFARYSWLKVWIDQDACRDCGKCAKTCKASCIDSKNHKIDYSRCVTCGECLENCSFGALRYSRPKKQAAFKPATVNTGRRNMLMVATAATATALAQEGKKVDGGLAEIQDKVAPERKTPITPPGALSAKNFAQHCTACQLCVSECPNDVLRPSSDLSTFMQPVMSYERGYCRPECNRCADVCPTHAIRPISLEQKSSTQIGHAVWVKKNCIPVTDDQSCGNCARHCPVGAIEMVPIDPNDEKSLRIPAIDETRCIGCGACENLCPARPFSAIFVEGHEVHKEL